MIGTASALDAKIAAAAADLLPLAARILREAIRIPADHVSGPGGGPARRGADPQCGLSNHEGPRIEFLRRTLLEIGGVRRAKDAEIDAFGNLHWVLDDPQDGVPEAEKRVIYLDGHCDTVRALREQWRARLGEGIDAYEGETRPDHVDRAALRAELGWAPPDAEWQHLLFGRGAADQLGGVVAQIVASKILLQLAPEGALRGCRIHSYATVAEEDNDGGGPMYIVRHVLPGAGPERIPDVVVLTEGTGDSQAGALGIYRGQRGRMQIEVRVTGRSCHGSMPAEGLNPLEYGAAIIAEAAAAFTRGEGFRDHEFLGRGTRTASFATLETPSDCAVPERFTFRFDRRLTVGETPDSALADVEGLAAVRAARGAGLRVEVQVPRYVQPTWRGFVPGNPQIYMGWETPSDHPAIRAAEAAYRRVVSPHVGETSETGGALRREPRVSRWVFSTDGVGFPVPADQQEIAVPGRKGWVRSGAFTHPAMFGLGPGIEQNTHKIGECVDLRELRHAIAFLARFPGTFAAGGGG
jgi:putative selenium metabolism hydrolase